MLSPLLTFSACLGGYSVFESPFWRSRSLRLSVRSQAQRFTWVDARYNVGPVSTPFEWGATTSLTGRSVERGVLDGLLAAVRGGESRALVIHGVAGVGKTALLDYLAERASGFRVEWMAGCQSEMELAFAGLHQLCAPMLDALEHLPEPQQHALRIAFGMSSGPAPDQFLIGLAVLGLLSDVAEEQPLLCLIDDQQWLDRASAQVLAFVGRRLGAESVAMVFGVRELDQDLGGMPELRVGGLPSRRGGGAAGFGAAGAIGHAGARSNRRRDGRQSAGATRSATKPDTGRAGRRIRTSRYGTGICRHGANLPHAHRSAAR